MAKKEQCGPELDHALQQRLATLSQEWHKPSTAIDAGNLSASDLRLMLEHFPPLRERVGIIAANALQPAPMTPYASVANTLPTHVEPSHGSPDIEAQAQLSEKLAAAQDALTKAQEKVVSLQNKVKTFEKQNTKTQKELDDYKASLARATPELNFLRNAPALARQTGLADLSSDDTQALIRTVAVLSQLDNLKQLWNILKGHCEADKRPVSAAERALLASALAWHNHNWQTKPYRLIEAAPSTAYDYEKHQRSPSSTTGETIAALYLPGIADGSGRPFCKALVHTR
jgi:hypothetical protein